MDGIRQSAKVISKVAFSIFALSLVLQGCNTVNIGKGAIAVDCKKTDGDGTVEKDCPPDDPECSFGCAPGSNAQGTSAQGFYGIGGANPVPAGFTCGSGTLCANLGMKNCNIMYPSRKCTHTYTYATQACACACK